MRVEKRKKYLYQLMLVILMLALPLTYARVLFASGQVSGYDLSAATGRTGIITDTFGNVLYDGKYAAPNILGNVIGGTQYATKTVRLLYSDELAPIGFNPLIGLDSLQEASFHDVRTTLLSAETHRAIQSCFGELRGAVFAYNYQTGEILVMLSVPSESCIDTSAYNRCMDFTYIPGSTFKISTVLCALDQNPSLAEFTYTCDGAHELPDGQSVKCHSVHGKLGMVSAIGLSCNAYMAALIEQFDVESTQIILRNMGIYQQGEDNTPASIDRFSRKGSSTVFENTTTFNHVWGLIGQGMSAVNVVDMAMIAGAVANNGAAAKPYLIQSITRMGVDKVRYEAERAKMVNLIGKGTANTVDELWKKAVDDHYGSALNNAITHAKTGTAEQGDGKVNRLLMGVMEEQNVAFYIVVENNKSKLIYEIANTLAEYIVRAS